MVDTCTLAVLTGSFLIGYRYLTYLYLGSPRGWHSHPDPCPPTAVLAGSFLFGDRRHRIGEDVCAESSTNPSVMLIFSLVFASVTASPSFRWCSAGDNCDSCTIQSAIGAECSGADEGQRTPFQVIDVDSASYLSCSNGTYRQTTCSDGDRTHFSAATLECVDPASMTFFAQGTSGSGRIGDVCSFNTDCLSGMYCVIGHCRCLSTYVAVDAYCYERISPSESGCFYDIQCSAVWPDAYCKSGQCHCPSEDMAAVKTRDGTVCIWTSSTEPSCPLPSLPPPDSAAAMVVLPGPSARKTVSIASCNPHSSTIPSNEEIFTERAHDFKCAVRGTVTDSSPKDVSDLYDCIDNSRFWQEQGLDTTSHPIGVCCMNRAFTCQQPKKGESEEIGAVPRWWFNGVIGSCQQFLFDPSSADVSPNNFETQDHCESFCKYTCPRGNPAYISIRADVGQIPQGGCTTSQPCADPYDCVDVASQSLCCPSRKSICSEAGARVKNALRGTPYDAGMRFDQLTGEQANYAIGISTRYYYNPIDGQCHPFTYNGFLGNFNNFHSQADCQMYCVQLQCGHGSPLTTGQGAPQRCLRDADCPSTHSCAAEHGVCCPTPQMLCTEPLRVGDCKQSVKQYWYNAETRTCEGFIYTGCQGNNNRFNSMNECHRFCRNVHAEPKCPHGRAYIDSAGKFLQCGEGFSGEACPANYECYFDGTIHGCCPSKAYTCSLPVNKGVACGSGSSYRYFYNNNLKECQTFLFLGCDGNSNNFVSVEKCQNYCEIAVCPNGGSPLRSNKKLRSCSASDACPSDYECTQVESNVSTQRRCCPTKASICAKPPNMGLLPKCSGAGSRNRFYFNVALQTCSPYASNGCDTSLNSFKSRVECEDFCLSAGCRAGDTVYKDPNSNRPFLCNTALHNNCPSNYDCTLNTLTQEHICCGSDDMGVCPIGEKAYIEPSTSTPRQCAMIADRKCPSGYLCRFSQNNFKYYCCGSITGSLCPSGRALFRFPETQLPLQCSISKNGGVCPPSFACQSDVPGAFQGYCCSQHPICPGGAEFHLDERTQMPTTCSREGFALCPQGFTCQQQPEAKNFYCCAGKESEGINDGCPPTEFAFVENGSVKSCDPFNAQSNPCPSTYTCQWSVSNQKYQCCGPRPVRQSKPNAIDDGCPSRQFALLDRRTGQPRICTAGEEKSCAVGFSCQFSAKRSQFQCCGQSGGCPHRRAAYVAVDGNVQECLPGPDMCADGYECVRSAYGSGKNICCSKENNDCGNNEVVINGSCTIQIKIGGSCYRDEECAGGSKCKTNTCSCESDEEVLNDACVPKKCERGQIEVHGKCIQQSGRGETCSSSAQCATNLRCLNNKCGCGKGEKIEGGVCVPEDTRKRSQTNCPLAHEHAFFEEGTTRMRYCSLLADDCPTFYSCQYSSLVKQNICCGEGDLSKKEKSDRKTERPKGTGSVKAGYCPAVMTPYLLNGKPKSCASSSCPYGFQCRYSTSKMNYYCCSTILTKSAVQRTDGGCKHGSVLLYPSTQEPVQCDHQMRACPTGYVCLPHSVTKALQCCSLPSSRDRSLSGDDLVECPSYMVRVTTLRNGRKTSHCAHSCPPGQTARNGVCQ
ncbi:hypothetical protein Q1695_004932 [Nippostrongylus brasiliensis]|nr:hypothetical protein Q1695_004932 [Nippostrongylus brasiliensis]